MKKGTNKKKKKTNVKSYTGLMILIIIVIALIGGFGAYYLFAPSFRIENRIENMKKIEEEEKDTVLSWLRVEGTNIDLPVIYRDSDTDVEKTDYDFAWSYPKTETLTNRAIFTSHNVLNVSSNPLTENENFRRFEALPAFLYPTFAKENTSVITSAGSSF